MVHREEEQPHDRRSKTVTNLKQKLKASETQSNRLKQALQRKQVEIQDLREEHNYQSGRISDLELQCLEKSAKLSQLSDLLEVRDTNDARERLLQKSMEHAEATLSVDRLRLELQRSESDKQGLKSTNSELSNKLSHVSSELEKMKKERERNSKLLLDMGDIVRTLNCVTLNYQKEAVVEDSRNQPQESPIKNIKRKIEAMEQDRLRLRQECELLRDECSAKTKKIGALESQFHSLNIDRMASTESDDSKNRLSAMLSRQILTQPSVDSGVYTSEEPSEKHEVDSESSHSDESSFSTLDAPDVPMERFEALKRELEDALDQVSDLTRDLEESETLIEKLQGQIDEDGDLWERYQQLEQEKNDAVREITALEGELEEALQSGDNVASSNHHLMEEFETKIAQQADEYESLKTATNELKEDFAAQLSEQACAYEILQTKANQQQTELVQKLEETTEQLTSLQKTSTDERVCLQSMLEESMSKYEELSQQHEALKSDYSSQLEELEKEVGASEIIFHEKCEALKHQHLEKTQALSKELSDFKKAHEIAITEEQTRYQALNDEVDVLVEMNTQLEDDLSELHKKYDEALTKIIHLEDQLEEAKETAQRVHEKFLDAMASSSDSKGKLQVSADISRQAMAEAVSKYKVLQHQYDEAQSKLGRMESKLEEATSTAPPFERLKGDYKDLVIHFSELERTLKKVRSDAATRQDALASAHKMALSKIDILTIHLARVGITIDENGNICSRGGDKSVKFSTNISAAVPRLKQTHVEASRASMTAELEWYHRLTHQVKLRNVQEALLWSSMEAEKSRRNPSSEMAWSAFLVHQRNLRCVHDAVAGMLTVTSEARNTEYHVLEDLLEHFREMQDVHVELGKKGEDKNDELSNKTLKHWFLLHQRRLQVVLLDVVARLAGENSPKCNEAENWFHAPENIDDARTEIRKLKLEVRKMKRAATSAKSRCEIVGQGHQASTAPSKDEDTTGTTSLERQVRKVTWSANAARIRYQAREKEHRLVQFQYQNLLRQYNEAVQKEEERTKPEEIPACETHSEANESTASPTEDEQAPPVLASSTRDVELKKLQKNLKAAEVKVEMMTLELRATKQVAEAARKQQEEGEKKLRGEMRNYDETRHHRGNATSERYHQVTTAASSNDEDAQDVSGIFRVRHSGMKTNSREAEGTEREDIVASFDGSQFTTGSSTVASAEGRDEKVYSDKVRLMGTSGQYQELQQQHDSTLHALSLMKEELADAKQSAELARAAQQTREDNLRDVIYQYKKLKSEHEALVQQLERNKCEVLDMGNNELEVLLSDRDIACAKITVMENELKQAKQVAGKAEEKRRAREEQLRGLIEQYRALHKQYRLAMAKVKKLDGNHKPQKKTKKERQSSDSAEMRDAILDDMQYLQDSTGPKKVEMLSHEHRCLSDDTDSKTSQTSQPNRKGKRTRRFIIKGLRSLGAGNR